MTKASNDASTVTFYPSFQALAAATAANFEERVCLRPATDYPAEDVAWLWPKKIPVGKLTLLIGDPGLGKSLIAIDVAARVTRGLAFPDCTPEQRTQPPALPGVSSPASTYSIGESALPKVCLDEPIRNAESKSASPSKNAKHPNTTTNPRQSRGLPGEHAPGSVLILSAEDQIADTIRPRLDAAGADPAKVFFAAEITDLRRDLHKLAQALDDAPDCRLIIVDPVNAFVGPSDSHFHTVVRKVLTPLAELAAQRGIAVLALTHLRKNSGAAITRATGSMAFAAAARCVWTVCRDNSSCRDQQHEQRNLLLPVKNNFGPKDPGLAYSIDRPAGSRAAVIAWHPAPVTISAEDALTPVHKPRGPAPDERRYAGAWLEQFLAAGPREAWRILNEGKHRGFGERTLRRALRELGGDTRKDAYCGGWTWTLDPPPTDPSQENVSEFDFDPPFIPQPTLVEKLVPLGETCPLPENTHSSRPPSSAANAPPPGEAPHFMPPPPTFAESIRFLNELDAKCKPPDQQPPDPPASDDPNAPTGHPLLDQLLHNFRKPLTTDDQQLTTQKKSARSHSRLLTGTDSWHFTRQADSCEPAAMHLRDVSAQALDESNTRRREDAV